MKSKIWKNIGLGAIRNGIELNKNPSEKKVEIQKEDYLAETIGAFGLWQAVVSVTVTLTRNIAVWNMMSITFLTPTTNFTCVEFSDNGTAEVKPFTCYNNCVRYNYSSVVGRTIIEDFQLICQDAWLASFTQSLLMFGLLVGASLFGWISDRFGRRIALILSTLINAAFMIALPFSPNYLVFNSIRFFIGIGSGGSLMICVTFVMEIIGKQYREIAAAFCLLPDCFAQSSLAAFAYYTSDWQSYSLSYGVASWIILILVSFVPESPRWLVSNGRVAEAIEITTSAASRNKLDTSNIRAVIIKAVEEIKLGDKNVVKTTYLDFVNSKEMFLLTLTVFIMWFTYGTSFYGIYQYLTLISGDIYITVIIFGLIQVPLCPIEIIFTRRFGRKPTTVFTIFVIGISMLILIFIPLGHWLVTILGGIGYSASSVGFAVAYISITELFPTPLRNMAYGLASAGAKVGAMIAPFIANMTPKWLPSSIFCTIAFVGCLCCFSLPETKGQNLKDSVEKK